MTVKFFSYTCITKTNRFTSNKWCSRFTTDQSTYRFSANTAMNSFTNTNFTSMTGFGMLLFFTNLSFIEFKVRYLALFLFFSVIDSFSWFWMGSLHKSIQLMPVLIKGPFLVLHFYYYILLMTVLVMLSVILLYWWYYSLL